MKATLLAALTLAMLALPAHGARAQTADTSEQADTALAVALWQIAVATHTRIGFQSMEVVNTVGGVFRNPPMAISSSLEEALYSAVAEHPGYEWRRMGEFVVVRPERAWTDAGDPFNRPVRHFRAEGTNEARVLAGISNLVHTGIYEERPVSGTPVAFVVEAGTVIDVMNRVAESADIAFWQAGYKPHPYEERLSRWDLGLTLVNDRSLRAASWSHTPGNRLPRPAH